MSKTSIEWTQQTWNPIVGCSIVSPGCTNCYAMAMASRIEAMGNQPRYDGTTRKVNGNAVWTGKLAQAPEATLLAPLRRKIPTTYFVNSMGDLFHEDCPDEWIDRVFAVMALCPQHTFQVLTKRAARMREYMADPERKRIIALNAMPISCSLAADGGHKSRIKLDHFSACFAGSAPFPNVWLGISAERQQEWDDRKEYLSNTPATVRFASFEPLLGQIIEPRPISDFIQWAIVGGESGHGSRPMHPEWARSLRDQCHAAGVKFFFKQWGGWAPSTSEAARGNPRSGWMPLKSKIGRRVVVEELYPEAGAAFVEHLGKKTAGRLLDGVEHNGMPSQAADRGGLAL